MKLKEGLILQQIEDEYILIDSGIVEPFFSGMIKLNESSKCIVEMLLKENLTEEEIVNKLMTLYEGNKKEIASSVSTFLKELDKTNILLK